MDFYNCFEEYFVEYTTEQCQYVLDHIQNLDDISYDMSINPQVIESILIYLEKYHEKSCSLDLKDMKIITLLKRITAYAVLTFLNKTMNLEVKILASRLIISICSVPSASAYGIYNSNILQQLLSYLTKIISNELKRTNKQSKHGSTKKMLETMNFQLEKQHIEGIRSSQRIATTNSNHNIELDDANSDNEDYFDTYNETDDFVEDNQEIKTNKLSKETLKFNQLSSLLRDILKYIQIFSLQSDEFLLNSTMDLFIAFVFLCAIDINFTSLSNICQNIIITFGTSNKYTLTSCYRGLLPIFTMATRIPILPDIFKIKKSCHKASINVLQALIATSIQNKALSMENDNIFNDSEDSIRMTQISNTTNDEIISTEIEQCFPTKTIVPSLSFPMVCIVALLQRMTLASPDKVQIRQVLLNSFIDVLTNLQELSTLADTSNDPQIISGITHYMSFLSKLSKSSKTFYRAFTLDIAAQILNTHWIWNYHSIGNNNNNNSSSTNQTDCTPPAYDLLVVLLTRCKDNSPAVRTRAISAITELLLNLSETSDYMMISAMYDLAMGVDVRSTETNQQSTSPKESLFDILRERVEDEKTHVRTKALQALSLAFSRSWKKQTTNIQEDDSLEPIQILIMEDDLELFASKCQDRSLSVRKQAMISLTDLLIARPKDSLIQDIWLKAVLPMCFDAETTVSNKVAETMHTVLFDNLVKWYQSIQNESSSNDICINLVWRLSDKISSLGLFKLLQSVLSTMLKQGFLTSSPGNSSSSVSYVTMILKHACCYHLNQSNDIQDHKNSFETSSLELDYMRSSSIDEVVRGAWILMEGLVSLSHMNVLNSKQETIKFGDVIKATGSADFVVHCYRQKHSDQMKNSKDAISYDEEDLRIFSVLEILCENLTGLDRQFMKEQLMLYLENFQCECSIASSVIAVMLHLTKAYVQEELQVHSLVKSKPIKSLKECVQEWADQLLTSAHTILHAFAFQSLPDLDLKSTSVVLITNVKRFLNDSHNTSNNSINTESDEDFLSLVQAALFIVGEIAMLGFSMEEDHSKTLLASKNNEDRNNTEHKNMEFFRLSVKDSLIDLVKVYMGNYLPVLEGITSTIRICPHKIRANAFITMGKLCMRDKTLARNHVNIFLREVSSVSNDKESKHLVDLSALCNDATNLDSSTDHHHSSSLSAAVRSNALLVLGDMCVRFTSLVDRHVDTMAQCLQDSNAIVRKNALILLTQLLLQDFLKWKGFLLYRFLLLTVDSDLEIAEFSRNILQKTLALKYPELLCSHFTETIVILNSCIEHPIYHSIVRTSIHGLDNEINETKDNKNLSSSLPTSDSTFITSLSKTQRFAIYEFMSENIDDETKIQICAKLVQDILSAVVDNTSLLTNKIISGTTNKKNHVSVGDLNSFENVLEDTLNLLRSPFLKVGQKQSSEVDDENDGSEVLNEDIESNGKGGVNAKAAFNQAKTKVLKKLSSQHLISHTLPVVISLKHVLEAVRSPLQGTLMEFLVSLIKHHKTEVEEVLQFDPSLKAEIEYDLKQFEKTKKEVQINCITKESDIEAKKNQSIHSSSDLFKNNSIDYLKSKSPYLDVQQLPLRSVIKPILRKSLGGTASRGRTPFDALKSPGMHLSDKMITSALRNTDHNSDPDVTDDVSRLTFSHSYHTSSVELTTDADEDNNFDTQPLPSQMLFANNDIIKRTSPIKQSRRRSWGVVVDSLIPESSLSLDDSLKAVRVADQLLSSDNSGCTSNHRSSPPQRYTPAKKIRGRKSRSPIIMKLGSMDFLTQPTILLNTENIIPVNNNIVSNTNTITRVDNNTKVDVVKPQVVATTTTTSDTIIPSNSLRIPGAKRGSTQQTDSLLSLLK